MPKLTKRDKIGLGILIGVFLIFAAILMLTIDRHEGPGRSFENNVLVEQRMRNLENR